MYFALTKGIPTKNAFDERRWNKHDLRNARSLKESMDAVHAFCGLMAGFEGFIINDTLRKIQALRDKTMTLCPSYLSGVFAYSSSVSS